MTRALGDLVLKQWEFALDQADGDEMGAISILRTSLACVICRDGFTLAGAMASRLVVR